MSEVKVISVSAKEQDHDECMTEPGAAEQDRDSDQELEQEESDEGYDEDGAPGKWVKPKNMGASVWYTDKKDMCRVVHPNGTFMDLPKEAFDVKTACDALGIAPTHKNPVLIPMGASAVASKRSRVMLFNEKATEPNPKAAACVLRDVRGPVIFCEHKFASKTLNYLTCSESLFCSISKTNPDSKVKPKTKKERKASTKATIAKSVDATVASIEADQKAGVGEFKCLKGTIIVPWTQETTQAIVDEVARSKYHILVVRGLWDEEGEMGKYLLVSTKCPKESRRAVKDFGDVESLNLREEEWFGRQGSNCWEDDIEGGTWTSEADISHDGGTKTLYQILSDLAKDDMISSIYTYPDLQSTPASHIKMLYERDDKAGRRARAFKMEPLVGVSEDDGAADD